MASGSNGDSASLDRDLINRYAGLAMQALIGSGKLRLTHSTSGELMADSLKMLASQSFAIAEAMGQHEKSHRVGNG